MIFNVLIADDQEDMRDFMRFCLDGIPCKITEAVGGEDALAKAKIDSPHILLTDMHMPPGMNGLQLTRVIKKEYKPFCIIVCTSDVNLTVEECKDAGANALFIKDMSSKVPINELIKKSLGIDC